MNPLFFPDSNKGEKTGLAKSKKLVQNTKNPPQTEEVLKGVPDNWYYNENQTENIWKSLENGPKTREMPEEKSNPFVKIDESAQKIRNLIVNYQLNDHDVMLGLLDMLDKTGSMLDLDQQTLLMEARYSLSKMIDNHAGNSDAQQQLLNSLRSWFQGVQASSKNDVADLPKLADTQLDATQLAQLIKSCCEMSESSIGQAASIHQTIIENYQKQIAEFQAKLADKNHEIQRLRESMEILSRGHRKANSKMQKQHQEQGQALNNANRKIMEQDTKINKLNTTVSTLKEQIEENNEENEAQFEGIDPAILAERELEFDAKIRVLNEAISNLRTENTTLQTKIKQDKLASNQLENKNVELENEFKIIKNQLQTEKDKFTKQINELKKKNEDMMVKLSTQGPERDEENMKLEIQRHLTEQKERLQANYQATLESIERKHKAQMQDFINSMTPDGNQKMMDILMKQQNDTLDRMTDNHKKEMDELRDNFKEKMDNLKRTYEMKNRKLEKEVEAAKEIHSVELRNALENQKIELDNESKRAVLENTAEMQKQLNTVRQDLILKIDTLKTKNRKLHAQVKSLQVIASMNDEAVKDQALFEDDDEEELLDENTGLTEEMMNLKIDMEVQKVKEEMNKEMIAQKKAYDKAKEIEIAKIKEIMQANFERKVAEQREKIVEHLSNCNSQADFSKMIKDISEQDLQTPSELAEDIVPQVPMDEFRELHSKYLKLVDENTFMKKTLENINSRGSNFNGDVVAVMRSQIADDAEKISRVYEENRLLREQLGQKIGKSLDEISGMTIRKALLSVCMVQSVSVDKSPAALQNSQIFEINVETPQEENTNENEQNLSLLAMIPESGKALPTLSRSKEMIIDIESQQNPSHLTDQQNASNPQNPQSSQNPQNSQNQQNGGEKGEHRRRMQLVEVSGPSSFEQFNLQEGNGSEHSGQNSRQSSADSSKRRVSFKTDLTQPAASSDKKSYFTVSCQTNPYIPMNVGIQVVMSQKKILLSSDSQIFEIEKEETPKKAQSPIPESPEKSPKKLRKEEKMALKSSDSLTFEINEKETKNSRLLSASSEHFDIEPSKKLDVIKSMPDSPAHSKASLISSNSQTFEINDNAERMSLKSSDSQTFEINNLEDPKNNLHKSESQTFERNSIESINEDDSTPQYLRVDAKSEKSLESNNVFHISPQDSPQKQSPRKDNKLSKNMAKTHSDIHNSKRRVSFDFQGKVLLKLVEFDSINKPYVKASLSFARPVSNEIPEKPSPIMKRVISTILSMYSAPNNDGKPSATVMFVNTDNKMEQMSIDKKIESLKVCSDFVFQKAEVSMIDIKGDKDVLQTQIQAINERQAQLVDMHADIDAHMKDLFAQHQEVVKALKKANDLAFGAIKTVGSDHPEQLIEKLQEQAAYTTNVVMERDALNQSVAEATNLLDRRGMELIDLREQLVKEKGKNEDLSNQISKILNNIAMESISEDPHSQTNEKANDLINFHKAQIDELRKNLDETQKMNRNLSEEQIKTESKIRELESKIVVQEVKKSVFDGLFVGPFVIFNTEMAPTLPKKGFSLSPLYSSFEKLPVTQEIQSTETVMRATSPINLLKSPVTSSRPGKQDDPVRKSAELHRPELILDENQHKQGIAQIAVPGQPVSLSIKKGRISGGLLPNQNQNQRSSIIKMPLPGLRDGEPDKITTISLGEHGRSRSFDSFEPMMTDKKTVVYVTRYIKDEKKDSQREPRNSQRSIEGSARNTTPNMEGELAPEVSSRKVIKTSYSPLQALKNRIDTLESILQNKSHQVLSSKDKEHALNQTLYKLTQEYKRLDRDSVKQNMLMEQYKDRIANSAALIARLTAENDELRQLLAQARKMALATEMFSKKGEKENAQMEEMRRQKILSMLKNINSGYNNDFISRQEAAAARWQRKKEMILERQRANMMNVLKAMDLLHLDPDAKEKAAKQPISFVRKLEEPEKPKPVTIHVITAQTRQPEYPGQQQKQDNTNFPTVEEALRDSSKGKIPKELKIGVVADPIKTK